MKKNSKYSRGSNSKLKPDENFTVTAKKKEEKDVQPEKFQQFKVEMSSLDIAKESKELIEDALKFIHGEDFSIKHLSSYKDERGNLSRHYWVNNNNLKVKTIENYALKENKIAKPGEVIKQFAVNKLMEYGFHKTHCEEALMCKGEFGAAYELLMSKYFDLALPDPESSSTSEQILSEWAQEIEALKSIYDTRCEVLIQNQIWAIHFELPYLVQHYKDRTSGKSQNSVSDRSFGGNNGGHRSEKIKTKDVCKFFKQGCCKFGSKCNFSHEQPTKKNKVDNSSDLDENNKCKVEIRFPKGSQYPYEPPLVSFTSEKSTLPSNVCLRLTQHLLTLCKKEAEYGTPCVFNLIGFLDGPQEEVLQVADCKDHRFLDHSISLFFKPGDGLENVGLIDNEPEYLEPQFIDGDKKKHFNDFDMESMSRENDVLVKKFLAAQRTEDYKRMMSTRSKLPAWSKKAELLDIISRNQVVVVCGETGCGKSTQVPQFILDDWLQNREAGSYKNVNIVCTQPRKISAMGVASRVAEEKGVTVGGLVGYQIHLDSCVSKSTRLTFCTTGVLLRRLEADTQLKSVSHILVDEVHERSEESDFLLLILKELLQSRSDLKVILMSATVNAQLFCDYFLKVPVIDIPGRTFPVTQLFLEDILEQTGYVLEENSEYVRNKPGKFAKMDFQELENELELCDVKTGDIISNPKTKDEFLTLQQLCHRYQDYSKQTQKNLYLLDMEKINYELIVETVMWIVLGLHEYPTTGSVLVFLPGIAEIISLHDKLKEHAIFHPEANKFVVIPLHSTLSTEEQKLVFKKQKEGVRKIILSTNIAETSITIDDCVFVIDTGKMKENRFDSNKNMESLDTVWVSRANALQRKGRAGRVMPGVCIHLYTGHRMDYYFEAQPVPEIRRVPLERPIIRIKMLSLFEDRTVNDVLDSTLEPPDVDAVAAALDRLQIVGALDKENNLTPLGHHLGALPVDVRLGKLILYGAIYYCVDSMLTIAACLSYRSPFLSSFKNKDECDARRKEFATARSDQLTILKAYNAWRAKQEKSYTDGRRFASEKCLSYNTLQHLADIKMQFLEHLMAIGFVQCCKKYRKRNGVDLVYDLTGPEWNRNSSNNKLLSSILCAALYPNIARVMTTDRQYSHSAHGAVPKLPSPEGMRFKTMSGDYVNIHPSSVNYNVCDFSSPYLVFQEKVRTSRVFIKDCSLVPIMALVLFTGSEIDIKLHNGIFMISLASGLIMFTVDTNEVAELLKAIQHELTEILEEKIKNPGLNLLSYTKGKKVITAIIDLITRS